MPFCLEFPTCYLPSPWVISHLVCSEKEGLAVCKTQDIWGVRVFVPPQATPQAFRGPGQMHGYIKRCNKRHKPSTRFWLHRGFWRLRVLLASSILNYHRCPLPSRREPVRVPPQRFPWQRCDLKQDSFLISRDGSSIHYTLLWRIE